jgi:uncharacterized protein (TIGR04222 family)
MTGSLGRGLLLAFLLFGAGVRIAAAEDWVIERLHVSLTIQPDGTIAAEDEIDVDFLGLPSHGIIREFRFRFDDGPRRYRDYDIDVGEVTAADGRRHRTEESTEGALLRVRIGDPGRTISGRETYRIRYGIGHALNSFVDRDELYWNASGAWPVVIREASAVVHAPGPGIERVDCYQGAAGSTERCASRLTPGEAAFSASRPLQPFEQMTIVVGLRKALVPEPTALFAPKPRGVPEFFDRTPLMLGGASAMVALALGGVGLLWWNIGRDRRYISMYYLSKDSREEPVPLLGDRPLAVEFEPPERIRPAQMGVLIDERADTLDVTATIVDLAVRNFVSIAELPKTGWFDRTDWQLTRLKDADDGLLPFERIVLTGLFDGRPSRKVSELKNRFYDDLARAKTALYADAVGRGWFPANPRTIRIVAGVSGVLVAAGGVFLTVWLGRWWGAGLMGLPVVAGGLMLCLFVRAMPRRTAAGRELMRRTLGFARYLETAETRQHEFAERAVIFTEYLPYAVAFKCVDRWARAFRDLDVQAATAGWYTGASRFDARGFSAGLGRLSSTVSRTMSSTPGSSGRSGFGGGSAGGGGGGGGGGRW